MIIGLYHAATVAGGPLITWHLYRRLARGKEDAVRFAERQGMPGLPRPPGFLVWCHAASIGEALSFLPVAERILAEPSDLHLLVTTGTVTSARIMAERLPARASHQYVPADRPAWVRRFLAHWRPDLAIWMESELWPNLLLATARHGAPMILLNARLSARSFQRWQRAPEAARHLLHPFALCLAQSEETADRLRRLGARTVRYAGNLKDAAAALPADPDALQALQVMGAGRPRWLAASTHAGEEEAAASVHQALRAKVPDLLTLIVPRHPDRSDAVAAALRRSGLSVARRSEAAPIRPETDIYLADTVGEMGLFYRLTDIAFIGGTLVPRGGQNPLEAARLNCAILHGPCTENFVQTYAELGAAGAALQVQDTEALGDRVERLLVDPGEAQAMMRASARAADRGAEVLDQVMAALVPYLPAQRSASGQRHAHA